MHRIETIKSKAGIGVLKPMVTLAVALAFSLLLAACSERQKLDLSNATTVTPLFMAMAEIFEEAHPDVSVTIVGSGSSVAILDVAAGNADAGASAREPTANEMRRVSFIPLAIDNIAIVAHESVERENITIDELMAISRGSDVEGLNEITFIGKAAAHGTYQAFQRSIGMSGEPLQADAVGGSNGEVLNLIIATRGMGYVSIADAERAIAAGEPLKVLTVDGISTGTFSKRNAHYPLARTLYFLLPRAGVELGPDVTPVAHDFLQLLLSPEGQNAIREAGFTPVP